MPSPDMHRIAVAEDDPIMAESLLQWSSVEGFRADWWRTGAQAISGLKNEVLAALVCDMRLPDMSGEDVFGTASISIARWRKDAFAKTSITGSTSSGWERPRLCRLPAGISPTSRNPSMVPRRCRGLVGRAREAAKRRQILAALEQTGEHVRFAAERLGVSRSTLFEKMRELGLRLGHGQASGRIGVPSRAGRQPPSGFF
jgi:DNA-binding NtrC family response regulator